MKRLKSGAGPTPEHTLAFSALLLFFVVFPGLSWDYHKREYAVFVVMNHNALLFQVIRASRSSRTSRGVGVSPLYGRSLAGSPLSFSWWVK